MNETGQAMAPPWSQVGKRCSLLQRRADMGPEAFRAHWAQPHAEIARRVPGIRRYTQNRVERTLWADGGGHAPYACDGIVELEFLSEPAMAEANASAAVLQELPADEPHFLRGITLCRVPVGARQTWPGQRKVMLALHHAQGVTGLAARVGEALGALPLLEHSVDPVHSSFHREALHHEVPAPQLFATLWFAPGADLAALLGPGSAWAAAMSGLGVHGAAWLCDPLPIVQEGPCNS